MNILFSLEPKPKWYYLLILGKFYFTPFDYFTKQLTLLYCLFKCLLKPLSQMKLFSNNLPFCNINIFFHVCQVNFRVTRSTAFSVPFFSLDFQAVCKLPLFAGKYRQDRSLWCNSVSYPYWPAIQPVSCPPNLDKQCNL